MYADRYWDEPTEDPLTQCSHCEQMTRTHYALDSEYDVDAAFCGEYCKRKYEETLDRCQQCNDVVRADSLHIHGADFCDDCCYKKWAALNMLPEKLFSFGRKD